MIVVADAGPLHYLILLDLAELLHRFYGEVVVPEAVADELSVSAAPVPVRDWISHGPSWLKVTSVDADRVEDVSDELDLGERSAIALAEVIHADLLLICRPGARRAHHRA
jgi:predicted nucleic acid-binding protein